MNLRDSLLNPLIFISYCYHEIVPDKSSIMETQNLILNPKSQPVESNSERYQFSFKYISSKKSMAKFFKLKKKPCFVVTFAQQEFFLKTLAIYNCRGLPEFKYQRYRVYWSSNQKLLNYYQHARTVQTICSVYQIICEIHLI